MGNHPAGNLIVTFAKFHSERRLPGETSADILEKAVKLARDSQQFSSDVDFGDDAFPGTPFGDLLSEVFQPDVEVSYFVGEGLYEDQAEERENEWHQKVYQPFRDKYELT